MSCTIGVIFAAVFDQFARFALEQFLLWGLKDGGSKKQGAMVVGQMVGQGLVLVRFVAGAVFVGFVRAQVDGDGDGGFCVARTSALPVGVLVTALDGVVVLVLVARAYAAGGAAKGDGDAGSDRGRGLMGVLLGLTFWTGVCFVFLMNYGIKFQANVA